MLVLHIGSPSVLVPYMGSMGLNKGSKRVAEVLELVKENSAQSVSPGHHSAIKHERSLTNCWWTSGPNSTPCLYHISTQLVAQSAVGSICFVFSVTCDDDHSASFGGSSAMLLAWLSSSYLLSIYIIYVPCSCLIMFSNFLFVSVSGVK